MMGYGQQDGSGYGGYTENNGGDYGSGNTGNYNNMSSGANAASGPSGGSGFGGGPRQRHDTTFVEGKLFIGGLDSISTRESVEAYCQQW